MADMVDQKQLEDTITDFEMKQFGEKRLTPFEEFILNALRELRDRRARVMGT